MILDKGRLKCLPFLFDQDSDTHRRRTPRRHAFPTLASQESDMVCSADVSPLAT